MLISVCHADTPFSSQHSEVAILKQSKTNIWAASWENQRSGFRPGPTKKQALRQQKTAKGLKFRI